MDNIQTTALGREPGTWVWCLHCEKCYQVGEYKKYDDDDILEWCPYINCSGDTMFDSVPWSVIRGIHPEYPEIPERDKIYKLY